MEKGLRCKAANILINIVGTALYLKPYTCAIPYLDYKSIGYNGAFLYHHNSVFHGV